MDGHQNEYQAQVNPLDYTPGTGSELISVLWSELPNELIEDILDKAQAPRLALHTINVAPKSQFATDMPNEWTITMTLLQVNRRTRTRTLAALNENGICFNKHANRGNERRFKRLGVLMKCSEVVVEVQQRTIVYEGCFGQSKTKLLHAVAMRVPRAGLDGFSVDLTTTWYLLAQHATAAQLEKFRDHMIYTQPKTLHHSVHMRSEETEADHLDMAWSQLWKASEPYLLRPLRAVSLGLTFVISNMDTASFSPSSDRTGAQLVDVDDMKELVKSTHKQEEDFYVGLMAGSQDTKKEKLMHVLGLVWQYISSESDCA